MSTSTQLNHLFISNWKDLISAQIGLECEFYSNYPYIKTLELLNLEFHPIEVWGTNQYHGKFEFGNNKFLITPDYSGGPNMVELITPPLNWVDARIFLIKMLNWIQQHGYTDDHCSLHVNISFQDLKITDINLIKLILNFNENYVYEKFPERRNNIYAQSIKWIMPFEHFDNSKAGLKNTLQCLTIPDDTKYYGINLQKKWLGYLEYRYIGGTNYEKKIDSILTLMDYFCLETRKAITNPLIDEDLIKLQSYLEDNINWYKKYLTYNDFLANIDGIKIEINKESDYRTICAYWDQCKKLIFNLLKNTESITNARINFNTDTSRLEIIDAILTKITYLQQIDFINCQITDCTLFNCDLINTEVTNGHIYNTNIFESELHNMKLTNCQALNNSKLNNCMFDGGLIDCRMIDGVFRNGHMGENADIDISVKLNTKDSFWQINPTDKLIKNIKK